MMTDEINTIVYPLPTNIRSYVASVNGYYTIVLNDNLSPEGRYRAYRHEMDHIINGDFEKDQKADFIELRAHKVETA